MGGSASEREPAVRGGIAGGVELAVRPRRAIRTLLVACVLIELALLLLDYHVNYGRLIDVAPIRNLVNATREDGLASWFGVTQTILVALRRACRSDRISPPAE